MMSCKFRKDAKMVLRRNTLILISGVSVKVFRKDKYSFGFGIK